MGQQLNRHFNSGRSVDAPLRAMGCDDPVHSYLSGTDADSLSASYSARMGGSDGTEMGEKGREERVFRRFRRQEPTFEVTGKS